jgi:hypothetical protein
MRLPIDTTTVKFAAAGPAEPVLDFETRQSQAATKATWLVQRRCHSNSSRSCAIPAPRRLCTHYMASFRFAT